MPDAASRFFLVDPLDGTKEYVRGGDDFTVNIALIEQGMPVLGAVYAPGARAHLLGRCVDPPGAPGGPDPRRRDGGGEAARLHRAGGAAAGRRLRVPPHARDGRPSRRMLGGWAGVGGLLAEIPDGGGARPISTPASGRPWNGDTAAGDAIRARPAA